MRPKKEVNIKNICMIQTLKCPNQRIIKKLKLFIKNHQTTLGFL